LAKQVGIVKNEFKAVYFYTFVAFVPIDRGKSTGIACNAAFAKRLNVFTRYHIGFAS